MKRRIEDLEEQSEEQSSTPLRWGPPRFPEEEEDPPEERFHTWSPEADADS